jgi:hypothetical protein
MEVLEEGHIYDLPHVGDPGYKQRLTFIRRSGGAIKYRYEHPGTNTQEVLRALIDRTKYLDSIIPAVENADTLYHLRMALLGYEGRAYRRKMDKLNREAGEHHSFKERDRDLPFNDLGFIGEEPIGIENLPVGDDGHILVK